MAEFEDIEKKANEEADKETVNSDEQTATAEEKTEAQAGEAEEATEKTADADAEEKEEQDPIEVLKAEIEQLKDKYLRSVAEFDNYRKRTLKEKSELILNGSVTAVKTILPVLDDVERALAEGEKTDDPAVLRDGMNLIYKKFETTLASLGVKKIETEGADFNTDYHEAVAMVPGMGDDKKGKVIDCIQTGYTLNDKVIRHARVAVGQ